MSQPAFIPTINVWTGLGLCLTLLLCTTSIGFTEETSVPPPPVQKNQTAEGDAVQERGVTKGAIGTLPGKILEGTQPPQPGGSPPLQLCHEVTHMMTQCKCFNPVECQRLTAICPGACPAGSQTCQCVPMFRGTPPPLPHHLCRYQAPLTTTECSCHNQTECQLLSPYCPGSCPAGSQSCTCTPLRRG
jgi:hypothetical protein